jgi:hypothetical protein
MNPVRGYTMLNFLNWMIRVHPEIETIEGMPTSRLLVLANEFEGGKLRGNGVLTRKWEAGLHFLLEQNTDWQGYGEARKVANSLRHRIRQRLSGRDLSGRPPYDPIRRYRSVPLHGVFLYSTEDRVLSSYISDHWDALDRMSNDFCDIHPSLDQLRGREDVYDVVNSDSELIHGIFNIKLSDLPGIIFWDRERRSEYVSLRERNDPDSVRDALRIIFEAIRCEPSIRSIAIARERIELETPKKPEAAPTFTQHIYGGQNIAQGTYVTQNAGIPLPQLMALLHNLAPQLKLEPERQVEFSRDVDVIGDSTQETEKRLSAVYRIKAALMQGGTQLGAAVIVDALEHLAKILMGG